MMDAHLERRLERALDQRRCQHLREDMVAASSIEALHKAHDKVLSEVPAAYARLGAAIAEINDAMDCGGVRLGLEPIAEPGTIEASFVVTLWPEDAPGHGLMFNVNHGGQLIALLCTHQSRIRLKSTNIHEADRTFYLDALVSLVEAGS
jgi:hypothetical protein